MGQGRKKANIEQKVLGGRRINPRSKMPRVNTDPVLPNYFQMPLDRQGQSHNASWSNRTGRRNSEAGWPGPRSSNREDPLRPFIGGRGGFSPPRTSLNSTFNKGSLRTSADRTALVPFVSSSNPVMGQLDHNLQRLRHQAGLESVLGHLDHGFRQSGLLPGSGAIGVMGDFGRRAMNSVSGVAKTVGAISAGTIGMVKMGLINSSAAAAIPDVVETIGSMAVASGGNVNPAGISWKDAFRTKFTPGPKEGSWASAYSKATAMASSLMNSPRTIGNKLGLSDSGGVNSSARLPVADEKRIARLEARYNRDVAPQQYERLVAGMRPHQPGAFNPNSMNTRGEYVSSYGAKAYKDAEAAIGSKGFGKRSVGDKVWHQANAHIVGEHYLDAIRRGVSGSNQKLIEGYRKNLTQNIMGLKDTQIPGGVMKAKDFMAKDFDLKAHWEGKVWGEKEIGDLRKTLIFNAEGNATGVGGVVKRFMGNVMPNYMSGTVVDSREAAKILLAVPDDVRQRVMAATSGTERRAASKLQSKINEVHGAKLGVTAMGMSKVRDINVRDYFQSVRAERLIRRQELMGPVQPGAASKLAMMNKGLRKEFLLTGAFGALDLAFNIAQINSADTKMQVMDASVSGMYTAAIGAGLFGAGAFGKMVGGGMRGGAVVGSAAGRGVGAIGRGAYWMAERTVGTNLITGGAKWAAQSRFIAPWITAAGQNKFVQGMASHIAARQGVGSMIGAGAGRVVGGALGLGTLMAPIMAYDIGTALMDSAYEREMIRREQTQQYNVAAHLSTPEAKMILTTERQKASMFARQAGMNFVAAQGEEAILFHQ